jgi:mono/diheme cytochrome c family protein
MLLASSLSTPKSASAIPVLANGQGGVNCGLCHSAVPQLNSYGRYVLMTNFSRGLNTHTQMMQNRSLPVALEVTANTSSQPGPTLPGVYSGLAQFLSGGFLGPKVSYFASVPVVTGGFPANSVDQVWAAYNGLSHNNGSLQIGKFPTPIFAPWTSQSLSLSGYGLASLPVGLNGSTLADNRWGASYTQLGHLGLIGNVSYLTGAGPIERAFRSVNEGTAWTGSIQYLSPESRWSGGVAGLRGSYPLPSGANDRYTRVAALASYSGNRYELIAMGIVGHDNNPNDGASPAADSHGISFETVYSPLSWLHADLRYEHTDDGLGNPTVNYIFGAAFSLRPNLILTVEDRASIGQRPALKYQLLWAGPWYRDRFPRGSMPSAMPMPAPTASAMPSGMPMPASTIGDAGAIANGRSIYFTGKDLDGTRITTATPSRFYQSCAACHGTAGAGGVQLADGAVSAKLGSQTHMLDQMSSMDGKKTPWTIPLFERAISAGHDENGAELSPVMPRWEMSKHDLHDIAVYIFTQIH